MGESAAIFCTVLLRFKTRGARGRHQWQPEQEAQLPEHPPCCGSSTVIGSPPLTAVLMMADSVEAASRSLKEHTEESIKQLVDKIIDGQIADGLLKSAPLTFRDVETIKSVFVDKLKTMFHTRISYPDLKK